MHTRRRGDTPSTPSRARPHRLGALRSQLHWPRERPPLSPRSQPRVGWTSSSSGCAPAVVWYGGGGTSSSSGGAPAVVGYGGGGTSHHRQRGRELPRSCAPPRTQPATHAVKS